MELRPISDPAATAQLHRADQVRPDPQFADQRTGSQPVNLPTSKLEPSFGDLLQMQETLATRLEGEGANESAPSELKEKFTEFVGQTLFGSMLASMRKTLGKPAYMHGGRTEEVFQKQLDQLMVEDLTEASADTIAEPMFDLFNMQQRS